MKYIVFFSFLFYIIYLYKNSKCFYFFNKKEKLEANWTFLIIKILDNYNFLYTEKIFIKQAYDYFINNPNEFDGATIVKDITQIKDLDISAMVHDFSYIISNSVIDRLKADWRYSQNYRKFDVPWSIAYGRLVLLILINITGIYSLTNLIKKITLKK